MNDRFFCTPCGRHFFSATGLFQHCSSSRLHRGEWCGRCQWLFVNEQARTNHVQASDRHGVCSFCSEDLENKSELAGHLINVHGYCSDCQLVCEDYTEHRVEEHHQCRDCGEEFQNRNNLYMVCGVRTKELTRVLTVVTAFPSTPSSIQAMLRMYQTISFRLCNLRSSRVCHLSIWCQLRQGRSMGV